MRQAMDKLPPVGSEIQPRDVIPISSRILFDLPIYFPITCKAVIPERLEIGCRVYGSSVFELHCQPGIVLLRRQGLGIVLSEFENGTIVASRNNIALSLVMITLECATH